VDIWPTVTDGRTLLLCRKQTSKPASQHVSMQYRRTYDFIVVAPTAIMCAVIVGVGVFGGRFVLRSSL
jgi:hypothetical protein